MVLCAGEGSNVLALKRYALAFFKKKCFYYRVAREARQVRALAFGGKRVCTFGDGVAAPDILFILFCFFVSIAQGVARVNETAPSGRG